MNADQPRPEQATTAEKMIVGAVPEIVAKLIAMAKDGHVPAAKYLVDRVLGRPARLPIRDPESISQPADSAKSASPAGLLSKLEDLASLCFPNDPSTTSGVDLNLASPQIRSRHRYTSRKANPNYSRGPNAYSLW